MFVYSPANRSAGHGRDNARPHATEETLPPKLALDNGRRVEQAPSTPDLLVNSQTARLQQRLDHIERRGDGGCDSTRETAGNTVSKRIVVFLWVHEFGYRLVRHELRRGKGHGHAEGGRVGDVKGL